VVTVEILPPDEPWAGATRGEWDARWCATATLNFATDYQARINGQDVADLDIYRTGSPLFTLTFADDNIFGVEPGVAQSVSEAYSFVIAPPPSGQYEVAVSTMLAGGGAICHHRYPRRRGDAFIELQAELEGDHVWHFVLGRSDPNEQLIALYHDPRPT
jgi:hypothetical protein